MSKDRRISATFPGFEPFLGALQALREREIRDFSYYSPVSLKEYKELFPRHESPVRWWTLGAGFVGATLGYWMCIGSSHLYNLITGGKPVVSWVPFTVIGFELTILTSALTTVAAVLAYARLWPRLPGPEYDTEFSVGTFGLSVPCEQHACESLVGLFKGLGASEVREI
jgi:molybdopterin-containing oxidoreductase family membrane subunit